MVKICYTCGMVYPDTIYEIVHVCNPTLNCGAIHLLFLKDSKSFLVAHSAPYRPDLHPLLQVHPRKRIQAMLDYNLLIKEAELVLRQSAEFRESFVESLQSFSLS